MGRRGKARRRRQQVARWVARSHRIPLPPPPTPLVGTGHLVAKISAAQQPAPFALVSWRGTYGKASFKYFPTREAAWDAAAPFIAKGKPFIVVDAAASAKPRREVISDELIRDWRDLQLSAASDERNRGATPKNVAYGPRRYRVRFP